jgi:hypothetical protein
VECIDGTLAHHWEIKPSNGATSSGTCKKCKQTQKFSNSIGAVTSWKESGQQYKKKHQLINLGGKEGK